MKAQPTAHAKGDLFDRRSKAHHMALDDLRDVLLNVGFKSPRKRIREMTLRVYPTHIQEYPLLNPWFSASEAGLGRKWKMPCLVFAVFSIDDHSMIDRRLSGFESTPDCAFIRRQGKLGSPEYDLHGYFVLPLRFRGPVAEQLIDFSALKEPLRRMLALLWRP